MVRRIFLGLGWSEPAGPPEIVCASITPSWEDALGYDSDLLVVASTRCVVTVVRLVSLPAGRQGLLQTLIGL